MREEYDLDQMAKSLEYMNSFDMDRFKRWVDASHGLARYEKWMIVTVQGLGKIDAKLVREDEHILENGKSSSPMGDLSDQITLSYLWVLGAYELVRTLDQRLREQSNTEREPRERTQQLKWKFERIRVPLAKFEASRRHSETDSSIAYPGINTEQGTAWHIAADTWVTRKELSHALLETCEWLKA